jgi:hypothetical protein
MWQDDMEATNNSSGLYFVLSPRKDGSDEHNTSTLFAAWKKWLRS